MYEISKRFFDVIISTFGLIIIAPIMVGIAFGVLMSSPGPIFFRAVRTGQFYSEFKIFKFRSMYLESELGAGTTSSNDPRITRFGKFIRKFKLDELPQLINVLKGDMSLVGPRPELPIYTSAYKGKFREILDVKPGITDLSSIELINMNQIIPDKGADEFFENNLLFRKNEMRLFYVQNRSFVLDMKILFTTFFRIMRL